jgi:membrane associated rhomboid family serine protease
MSRHDIEPDPRQHHEPNTHVRRWGAVYVLLVLFLGSWIGHFFAQLSEFRGEQREHGQAFAWADYWPAFLASTFENWQSEWFQLIFQAILLLGAKHILFRVDAEDLERLEAKVDKLNRQLEHRESAPDPGR